MSEDVIKELQNRMKEIETIKAKHWEQGSYDPLMEGEYWDCQIVIKQMQEGENIDVSELQKKKLEGMIAAQQQLHKVCEE